MSNPMKKCAACHIPVKSYFTYCPNCGAKLRTGPRHWSYLIFLLLSALMIFSALIYAALFTPDSQPLRTQNPASHRSAEPLKSKAPFDFSRVFPPSPRPESPGGRLAVGQVLIYDIAGNKIAESKAAVSESGWVAIPSRLIVGGYRWVFRSADGQDFEIFGGIAGDHDDIGIWQFDNRRRISGPPIFPADPVRVMTWQSLVSDENVQLTGGTVLSEQQHADHFLPAKSVDAPGVFIQDQHIVGWTFGDSSGTGYLWKGVDEKNRVYELSVDDFYRLTFENSREEQFILAYAKKDLRPLDQLRAFAGGFRHEPMLFDDNTPDHLKSPAVIAKMRLLISQIMEQGAGGEILTAFDGKVLSAAGDVPFLIDVITFGDQINGPERSIDIIDEVIAFSEGFNSSQAYQIEQLRTQLYRKWLTVLINSRNYAKGIEVYQRAKNSFNDAPEIHLLGVKLALSSDDWRTAETILYAQRFPMDLTEQVRILEQRIAELKFQKDKIVIRFSPGAGRIPVAGLLNSRMPLEFIVDTGASVVTIPTDAARKLGIETDEGTPLRKLITAGGMIEAPQVVLDAIELDGWTEYNVMAYVVDIPDQPGIGLLGLNYLNRFRMDINSQSGVLTLAPR